MSERSGSNISIQSLPTSVSNNFRNPVAAQYEDVRRNNAEENISDYIRGRGKPTSSSNFFLAFLQGFVQRFL
jgi:hypothetical protein